MASLTRQLVASACILANGLIAGATPSFEASASTAPASATASSVSAAHAGPAAGAPVVAAACGVAQPPPDEQTSGTDGVALIEPPSVATPPPAKPTKPRAKKAWERLLDGSCKLGKAPHTPLGKLDKEGACDAQGSWKVGLTMPDLPITDLDRLDKYVRWYSESTYGRKVVTSWLRRSGRHRFVVARALRARDLPHDLQAVVFVESGYMPTVKSPAGAVGLWQFMPKTGKDYGLVIEPGYDERRSVERSTEAAISHLSDLYGLFGSWELSLAAYSMGAKALARKMRDFDTEDFWQLSDWEALPKETIGYVPKILAFAVVLRNLERFGFDDVAPDPPWFTSDVEIPSGIHLGLVARAAGTSLVRMRELNPEILGDVVPGRGRDILVHIPSAGLSRAKVMLPKLLFDPEPDGLETKVAPEFDWGQDELSTGPEGKPTPPPGPIGKAAKLGAASPLSPCQAPQSPSAASGPTCAPPPPTASEPVKPGVAAPTTPKNATTTTKKVGSLLRTRPKQ